MTYPKSWDTVQTPQIGTPEYYEMLRHEWNDFGPFFQYYSGNIRDSIPKGIIELDVFIEKIRNPKDATKGLMFDIRTETDKGRRDKLKTKLPAFTPCAIVHPGKSRKYDNIEQFTGIAMLDFDGLPSREYAVNFKEKIFNKYTYIIASWLSSSGRGVRAALNIPRVHSTDEFKLHFAAIEKEFKQYKGFDPAPKNAILPLFFSYDPNILYREDPTTFTDTYVEPEPPKPEPAMLPKPTGTGKYHEWALSNIEKSIQRIQSNGHPQLRAAAYAAGGYVGAGYITEHEAIELIDHLIVTGYLKGKASSYKRTAREMIKKGQSEPLYFN